MRAALALLAVCALAVVPVALADEPTDPTPTTCDAHTATWHFKESRQTADAAYSRKHWKHGPKRAQTRQIRRHITCLERRKDRAKIRAYVHRKARALGQYRSYRKVTPYRCQHGIHGYWAIPCAIISCESHFSWGAANPSGAVGPYQLLGWGAPFPVRGFKDKLEHHRIAARVYAGGSGRSNWVC